MPSGLPGFLRRSLRIGYDDNEENDDEDENDDDDNVVEEDVPEQQQHQQPTGCGQSTSTLSSNAPTPVVTVSGSPNEVQASSTNKIDRKGKNEEGEHGKQQQESTSSFLFSTFLRPSSKSSSASSIDETKTVSTQNNEECVGSNCDAYNITVKSSRIDVGGDGATVVAEDKENANIDSKHDQDSNDDGIGCFVDDDDSSIDVCSEEELILGTISEHHRQQQEEIYNLHNDSRSRRLDLNNNSNRNNNSNNNHSTNPSPSSSLASPSSVKPTESQMEDPSNSTFHDSFFGSPRRSINSNSTGSPYSYTKSYRELQFEKILFHSDVVNISELSALAWNGIPIQYRAMTWKLLLGYLPANTSRRNSAVRRKRTEYMESCVRQHYDCDDDSRTIQEQEVLRQVLVDVPRTQPMVPLFRNEKIKRMLSRLLYIWAMRHPASSYVQGINDLTTPLVAVFLADYFIHDIHESSQQNDHDLQRSDISNASYSKNDILNLGLNAQRNISSSITITNKSSSPSSNYSNNYDFLRGLPQLVLEGHVMNHFPDEKLDELEADVYWCLTNLLAGIQDHYTADQPGLQRMVGRLEELTNRIDGELCRHFRECNILFLQFSFKWMNCLLLREFTLKCVFRLWDTYLSEGVGGFEDFHVYVCAAFLCQFSSQLQEMSFDELFTFMQDMIPTTQHWTDTEIEVLLSQAYVLSTLFRNSDAHLTSTNPITM